MELPQDLGGDIHSGYEAIYGASNNDRLLGWDVVGGGSFEVDVIVNLGISASGSTSLKGSPFPLDKLGSDSFYIDPVSKRTVDKYQLDVVIGGNIAANGIDAGIFGGFSNSFRILQIFDIDLPWED